MTLSVRARCALLSALLGVVACGPTTQFYSVSGGRPQLHAMQKWTLEVDVEECRLPKGRAAPPEGAEEGFVELAPGCQLPMHWLAKRQPGIGLRRFAVLGGPYRCSLNGAPLSIQRVEGTVVGDALTLTVDFNDALHGRSELSVPEQVVLQGAEDGSQSSNMICGLPAKPATN